MRYVHIVGLIIFCVIAAGSVENGQGQSRNTQKREKPRPAPSRTSTAHKDTVKTKPVQEKTLPAIQLKNYVITGKEQVTLPPSEKPTLYPQRVIQKEIHQEVDEHRSARPLTIYAIKPVMTFLPPSSGRTNNLELGYGRYSDTKLSGQIARTYQAHDGIAGLDFHRTNGFMKDAGESEGRLRVGDAYKFTNSATGNLDVQYGYQGYKFYGSPFTPMKRTIQDLTGNARINLHASQKLSIGFYGGGLMGSVKDDEEKVPAHSLFGSVQVHGFVGPHLITANLDATKHSYERNKIDGGPDQKNPHNWDKIKSFKLGLGFEGTVKRGLHLRAGGTLFENEDMAGKKISRFYPYASLSKAVPQVGEIFAEFTPEILSGSLFDMIAINRYFSSYSVVSFVNYPITIHAGWRKRTAQGITWEASYIYKKVEHLGIEVDPFRSGIWSMEYGLQGKGFKTTLQGMQFVADWQTSAQVSLWGTISVLDYSLLEHTIGGNIPYHANVTGSTMVQFRPGSGFQLELSAKYVGKRFVDLWGSKEFDPYVLANFHIGKRFRNNIEAGVSIYNLFNQKFEIRDLYQEPDMVSTGVLKFYW